MADGGRRLSGLIPLVVVIVIVVLFARSCFQRLDLGDETEPEDPEQGLGQVNPDGDDEDADDLLPQIDEDELAAMLEPRDPECPDGAGEAERHLQWTGAPPMCIDEDRAYSAILNTSAGDIEIELDVENAPQAVNNFVFLAGWGYYDGTDFDAVLPADAIYGGLPLGAGGDVRDPGYTVEGELPLGDDEPAYPRYSVAMGSTGDPGSSRGVFFIELRDDGLREPRSSRFGHIEDPDSRAVVDEIEATGVERYRSDGTPPPGQAVVVHEVTISEH